MAANTVSPRLHRSPTEHVVAGVCGGLAEDLEVEPSLVRLAFIVGTLWGGLGLLINLDMPAAIGLVPVVALALSIGLFEATFWRGWVLQQLEEAFGLLPALVLGCVLYAAYRIGYGMNTKGWASCWWWASCTRSRFV
jgi:phage shock protein PspC (stress-responsive transcriptional regulator)